MKITSNVVSNTDVDVNIYADENKTSIHLNLDSLFIPKTDIDKLAFGLYSYAVDKGLKGPYIFTANITTNDNSYLGILKNNNIHLVEEPKSATIVFDKKWKKSLQHLLLIQNMPRFNANSRACIYIDWDNIQVSSEYIKAFITGTKSFIDNTKVHVLYKIYVFLHNKISSTVKQIFRDLGVDIVLIIKDKTGCGDEEILRFIRKNTCEGDSICIASGDRDFSSLMVEFVRNKYNVFLIYNKQALYTFKHNTHWLASIDIKDIKGVNSKPSEPKSQKISKTKPCKFYNLDVCNAVSCTFLHICGICGRPHKMQDFHDKATNIKNTICKKYNLGVCVYNRIDCKHLHICSKCKKSHAYTECDYIIMYCPICKNTMNNTKDYIEHQMNRLHQSRIKKLSLLYPKKFYSC